MTDEISFTYKNYRGEVDRRRVRARDIHVSFGATHYHPEPQIIFRAFDLDKEAVREFAMKDMDFRDEVSIAEDQWFDPDTETTWTRPTAWAYAMVCKARDTWQQDSKSWNETVESMLSEPDSDVVRVHEGGGPEDLKMSLAVSFMKTRKMRDDALRHVGEMLVIISEMKVSARAFVQSFKDNGITRTIRRAGDNLRMVHTGRVSVRLGVLRDFIRLHEETSRVSKET